jgi:hypothetical protein
MFPVNIYNIDHETQMSSTKKSNDPDKDIFRFLGKSVVNGTKPFFFVTDEEAKVI